MIRIRYSIVCDYCNKLFCDSMNNNAFDNHELLFKFQEAKKHGWGIVLGSSSVLCDECKIKGITYFDINDKYEINN